MGMYRTFYGSIPTVKRNVAASNRRMISLASILRMQKNTGILTEMVDAERTDLLSFMKKRRAKNLGRFSYPKRRDSALPKNVARGI